MGTRGIEGAARRDGFCALPERFTIVHDKAHPLYDHRVDDIPLDHPDILALIESIYTYGVKSQIEVVEDGDDLLVKDGNQRVRATTEANKRLRREKREPHQILFKKVKLVEATCQEEKSAANTTVKSPPMTRAREALDHANHNKSTAQIAVAMGCSAQQVENYLALAGAAPEIQRAVEKGLPQDIALRLAKMKRERGVEALHKLQAAGATKGAHATRAVAAVRRGQAVPTKDEVHRMRNRSVVQPVFDVLLTKDVKPETKRVALPLLRWLLGEPGSEDGLPDDVLEALREVQSGAGGNGTGRRGGPEAGDEAGDAATV